MFKKKFKIYRWINCSTLQKRNNQVFNNIEDSAKTIGAVNCIYRDNFGKLLEQIQMEQVLFGALNQSMEN